MRSILGFPADTFMSDSQMGNWAQSKLYGKGVFTTIAVVSGTAFLFGKHWDRLSKNSEKIGLDISELSDESVLNSLSNEIVNNSVGDGRARVTILDERSGKIWPGPESSAEKLSLSFLVTERRENNLNLTLSISPYPINSRSPIAGIKSCNYLEPIMSLDEAKARGFHEAIRVNEHDFVTSACMANVFWLKGGELFTPGLATGCLAGTTREFVLESIDCREVEVGIEALHNAEAIFLTSAGIGVAQVAEFEGRRLGKVDHPILNLLPY